MRALGYQVIGLGMLALAGALPAAAQDALVERGAYLVNGAVACGNCHNSRDEQMAFIPGKEFAGGFHIVEEGVFDVYAANITPDPETGIGDWTDEEIITAIREGKSKDGRIIFPPMAVPTYNGMSDDDVKAIVAYLRSVPPVHNEVPESKYMIPQQAMPPAKGAPAPSPSDKVAYGGYIVNALAHCFECHTPFTPEGMPDMTRLGAGGFKITLAPGMEVVTANITPDPETGIGKWSDEEIKTAMTKGVRPDGGKVAPPMPVDFFKNMTEEDLDAVVAYLRTIPPVSNEVERTDFQKQAFP
jgi:mono/diheme cytochrome c family protein